MRCLTLMNERGWRDETLTTKLLAAAALVLSSLFIATAVAAADLEVSIEGLRSDEGNVRVSVHRRDGAADFPNGDGVSGAFRRADPDGARFVFADLAPGDYAAAAFHDEDADGELDTNALGLPTEGYGFSNDARGMMGPPGFDAAAITVGAGADRLSVIVPIAYPFP